jgi:hypothetical protein
MPASLRRRDGRLALGVNKKIRVHVVEQGVTVGVMATSFRTTRGFPALKAHEGAERSSVRRPRGRRGLRKGKKRARGRQPRSSTSRQPRPKQQSAGPKSRVIKHQLRMYAFHGAIRDKFVRLIRSLDESGRLRQPDHRYGGFRDGLNWKKTKARWFCLHHHLVRTSSKFLADVALSHSFNAFIEDVVGIRLVVSAGVRETNQSSMASLLNNLGSRYRTSPERDPGRVRATGFDARIESSGTFCTGLICRVCGCRSRPGVPCPGRPVRAAVESAGGSRRYRRPQRRH